MLQLSFKIDKKNLTFSYFYKIKQHKLQKNNLQE